MASVFKRGGKKNRYGHYQASYINEHGKRVRRATGTADYAAATQIAGKWETEVALRKRGIISGSQARIADENQRHIREHIADYLTHCRHIGQDKNHVLTKESQLEKLIVGAALTRLSDLEAGRIEKYLATLLLPRPLPNGKTRRGSSYRTHNHHRCTAVSFSQWCVDQGRLSSNPLSIVPTLNTAKDRRRVRRAMTPAQLGDLISVCGQRRTYYLFAYYTGIRVKAAKAATWGDVDFDGAMIRVKVGNAKGKIEDVYHPIHPALLRELIAIKPMDAKGADKIFTHVPTVVTFHRDCKRAGIPRFDEEGRQLDRHALRTTLGTHLAQYGVLPQQAMKVLGHSDVRITMKHYTALRISDTAKAVQSLPTIQATVAVETVAAVATGTDPACHHICHHPCSTSGQSLASSVTMAPSTIAGNVQMQAHDFTRNCRENVATFPSMASSVLPDSASPDTIAKTRAISSVG